MRSLELIITQSSDLRGDVGAATCVHLSELSAGLADCKGRSAVQKSSTVNFPSFLSAPYIAIILPESENRKCHDIQDTLSKTS